MSILIKTTKMPQFTGIGSKIVPWGIPSLLALPSEEEWERMKEERRIQQKAARRQKEMDERQMTLEEVQGTQEMEEELIKNLPF